MVIVILVLHQIYGTYLHPFRIGWDPALHLQAAHLITQGKVPYVDMFDVNPPLIWYLDAIPAFMGTLLGLPITQTFSLFLTSLIGYASALSLYLMLKTKSHRELVFVIPFILGLIGFNYFLRFDFGQREDIFVLLYMPFFLLRWLRWNGEEPNSKILAVVIGLIGGVGICLKPYFLIPCGLVELYWLIERREPRKLFSIEVLSAIAIGVLYLAHFLFVPAQMRDNYFGYLLPAFVLGYHFWDTSLAAMYSPPDKRNVFFLMVVASSLAIALRRKSSLFLPLVVFTVASNIPYLMQFKGWAYHNQPVYAGAFILASMIVGYVIYLLGKYVRDVCNLPSAIFLYAIPLLVCYVAVDDCFKDAEKVKVEKKFSMEIIGSKGKSPISDVDSPFLNYFERYFRKGDTAIFMSNGVTPGYPLLTQLNVPPGSRHLHCVILSVLSYVSEIEPQTEKTRRLNEYTRIVVDEYGEDIKKNRPKLVFVQISPVDGYLAPFNFEANYLSGYEKIDEVANFKVFLRKFND